MDTISLSRNRTSNVFFPSATNSEILLELMSMIAYFIIDDTPYRLFFQAFAKALFSLFCRTDHGLTADGSPKLTPTAFAARIISWPSGTLLVFPAISDREL